MFWNYESRKIPDIVEKNSSRSLFGKVMFSEWRNIAENFVFHSWSGLTMKTAQPRVDRKVK